MSRPLPTPPYLIGVPHLPERLLKRLDDRSRRPLTPAEEREFHRQIARIKQIIRANRTGWETLQGETLVE